jgi:hypothetical protein
MEPEAALLKERAHVELNSLLKFGIKGPLKLAMESSPFMTTNKVSPVAESPMPIGVFEEAHEGILQVLLPSNTNDGQAEVVPLLQQGEPVPNIVETFSNLKSAILILLLLKSLMIRNLSSCEISSSIGILNFAKFKKGPSANPLMPFTFPMTNQAAEKAAVVLSLSLKSFLRVASASTIP